MHLQMRLKRISLLFMHPCFHSVHISIMSGYCAFCGRGSAKSPIHNWGELPNSQPPKSRSTDWGCCTSWFASSKDQRQWPEGKIESAVETVVRRPTVQFELDQETDYVQKKSGQLYGFTSILV